LAQARLPSFVLVRAGASAPVHLAAARGLTLLAMHARAPDCRTVSFPAAALHGMQLDVKEAVRRACALAAISVTSKGTQKSYPSRAEVGQSHAWLLQ